MAQEKKNSDEQPSRTTNTEWRQRRKRQKIFGLLKTMFAVVFMGVLVGLAIVYKDVLEKWLNPPAQQVTKAPPKKAIQEPKAPIKPAPVPEVKKAAPPIMPEPEPEKIAPPIPAFDLAEEKKAQTLLASGVAAMSTVRADKLHFDFDAGKKMFKEASELKAKKETHDTALEWLRKADEFKLAIDHVVISEIGTTPVSYKLMLSNGQVMEGLKVKDDPHNFSISVIPGHNPATLGKSTFTIPKAEISTIVPVELSKRHEMFRTFLSQIESESNLNGNSAPREFYDLAFLSKRLGLARECIDYLDRAYAKCPQGQLGTTFRRVVVDRAIERASLLAAANQKEKADDELKRLLGKTLPGYQVANDEVEAFRFQILSKMKSNYTSTIALNDKAPPAKTADAKPSSSAQELASQASDQGGAEEIKVDSSNVKSAGAAGGIVAQANEEFELGLKYYKQFRSGTGGQRNAALRAAADHLGKAVDLYGTALEKDPNNAGIESRQQEANMIRYGCMKYLTL